MALAPDVLSLKPLRPWVMVYDSTMAREDARLLNLDLEYDLSIRKSVRPALLSARVHAYLSPRKCIAYFFDDGPPRPLNSE